MIHVPHITIVIPVRNRADIVGKTLESVAAQTLRPLRVVMVDNGSTDATMPLLQQWHDKMEAVGIDALVVSEPRPGAAVARNRGLQEVSTEYVMFFDSDDVMAPEHCSRVATSLLDCRRPDLGCWPVSITNLDGSIKVTRFNANRAMMGHIFHGWLSTQRFVVRTDLIRNVGGWRESLYAWDDYELGLRLLMQAKTVVRLPYLPADSVKVYAQADSITGTRYSDNPDKWEAALHACANTLYDGGRRDLLRWVGVRMVLLADEYRREGRGELSETLMRELLQTTPTRWQRLTYRFLLRWSATVGRGVSIPARILL
jgi:glycosyltransferase involved in cell wall biosynthesis